MMFSARIVTISCLLPSLIVAQKSRPGQCGKNSDDPCPEGATCTSVENDVSGLERTSSCVLDPVCAGNQNGQCPTFSAWPKSYRDIQALCAFTVPDNCAKDGGLGNDEDDTVTCYNQTISISANETMTITGIYSCNDLSIYDASNLGHTANLTATQIEACQGETAEAGLCNFQGKLLMTHLSNITR